MIARTAVVGGAAYYVAKRSRRAGRQETAGNAVSPQEPGPAEDVFDPIEQIKQLNELRSQGILSDEEFVAEKKKLLGT
jgi:hypothetical protein